MELWCDVVRASIRGATFLGGKRAGDLRRDPKGAAGSDLGAMAKCFQQRQGLRAENADARCG